LPVIVNFSMEYFLGAGQFIPMPFSKVVEVFAIVVCPECLPRVQFSDSFIEW